MVALGAEPARDAHRGTETTVAEWTDGVGTPYGFHVVTRCRAADPLADALVGCLREVRDAPASDPG